MTSITSNSASTTVGAASDNPILATVPNHGHAQLPEDYDHANGYPEEPEAFISSALLRFGEPAWNWSSTQGAPVDNVSEDRLNFHPTPTHKPPLTWTPTKYSYDTTPEHGYDAENPEAFIASALHRFGERAMKSSPWESPPTRGEEVDAVDNCAEGTVHEQGCGTESPITLPLRGVPEVVAAREPPWNWSSNSLIVPTRTPATISASDDVHTDPGPVCRFGYPLKSPRIPPTPTVTITSKSKSVHETTPNYKSAYNWAQYDKMFMEAPDEDWESDEGYDVDVHVEAAQHSWQRKIDGNAITSPDETQVSGIAIVTSASGNPYPQGYTLHPIAQSQRSYPQANATPGLQHTQPGSSLRQISSFPSVTWLDHGDGGTIFPTRGEQGRQDQAEVSVSTSSYRLPMTLTTTEAAMSNSLGNRGAASDTTHTNDATASAEGNKGPIYEAVGEGYQGKADGGPKDSPLRVKRWIAYQYQ